jgi:hypothetical protein
MTITPAGIFAEAYERAKAVAHRTVWVEGTCTIDDSGKVPLLMFFSTAPDTVARAKQALADAKCLCDTDLGSL